MEIDIAATLEICTGLHRGLVELSQVEAAQVLTIWVEVPPAQA